MKDLDQIINNFLDEVLEFHLHSHNYVRKVVQDFKKDILQIVGDDEEFVIRTLLSKAGEDTDVVPCQICGRWHVIPFNEGLPSVCDSPRCHLFYLRQSGYEEVDETSSPKQSS